MWSYFSSSLIHRENRTFIDSAAQRWLSHRIWMIISKSNYARTLKAKFPTKILSCFLRLFVRSFFCCYQLVVNINDETHFRLNDSLTEWIYLVNQRFWSILCVTEKERCNLYWLNADEMIIKVEHRSMYAVPVVCKMYFIKMMALHSWFDGVSLRMCMCWLLVLVFKIYHLHYLSSSKLSASSATDLIISLYWTRQFESFVSYMKMPYFSHSSHFFSHSVCSCKLPSLWRRIKRLTLCCLFCIHFWRCSLFESKQTYQST